MFSACIFFSSNFFCFGFNGNLTTMYNLIECMYIMNFITQKTRMYINLTYFLFLSHVEYVICAYNPYTCFECRDLFMFFKRSINHCKLDQCTFRITVMWWLQFNGIQLCLAICSLTGAIDFQPNCGGLRRRFYHKWAERGSCFVTHSGHIRIFIFHSVGI